MEKLLKIIKMKIMEDTIFTFLFLEMSTKTDAATNIPAVIAKKELLDPAEKMTPIKIREKNKLYILSIFALLEINKYNANKKL